MGNICPPQNHVSWWIRYLWSIGVSLILAYFNLSFCVLNDFLCFSKKKRVFRYSMYTLVWYWCYYPHRSRDALSHICGIFLLRTVLCLIYTFTVYCLLFTVICIWFYVNDWLFTFYCSLSSVFCFILFTLLLLFTSFTCNRLLITVYWLLPTVSWWLFAIGYFLFIVYYSLINVHCLLSLFSVF